MTCGRLMAAAVAVALGVGPLSAQVPRPFPQPVPPTTTAKPVPEAAAPAQAWEIPSEATLGVPLYPAAQFIASYDAGRGQRFYLFGVAAPFLDMVNYYRTALKQRGSELFESPPTHQFDVGRYREDTMAFPPSVTIKDYTWGGAAGYPNPKPGADPAHFPTIIQIVPAPAAP